MAKERSYEFTPDHLGRPIAVNEIDTVTGRLTHKMRVVSPIRNSDLSSQNRSNADRDHAYSRVDAVIEDRLSGIQNSVLSGEIASGFSERYGLIKEKRVDSDTARFIAYIGLYDEHTRAIKAAELEKDKLNSGYNEFKEQTRSAQKQSVRANRSISSRFQEVKPNIDRIESQIKEEKAVIDLIFRKAVMEIFSSGSKEGTRLDLDKVRKIASELCLNLDADYPMPVLMEKITSDNEEAQIDREQEGLTKSRIRRRAKDSIYGFIKGMSSYLEDTKDTNLFQRYSYKNGELVGNTSESEVLEKALTTAVMPEKECKDESSLLMKSLAGSYLRFLGHQAVSKEANLKYKYPRLGLLHDLYTAMLNTHSQRLLGEAGGNIVKQIFRRIHASTQYKQEAEKVVNEYFSNLSAADRSLKDIQSQAGKTPIGEDLAERMAEKQLDILNEVLDSDSYAIVQGLIGVDELPEMDSTYVIDRVSLGVLSNAVSRYLKNKPLIQGVDSSLIPILMHYSVERQAQEEGVEGKINLVGFTANILATEQADEAIKPNNTGREHDKSVRIKKIRDYLDKVNEFLTDSKTPNKFWNRHVFMQRYCERVWDSLSNEELGALEQQNEKLWDEILDKSVAFVSPRGDQFSVNNDPQLADYGINSIQFRIDKNHPREHMAIIDFGLPEAFIFWLNTKGEVLLQGPDKNTGVVVKKHLAISSDSYQAFTNVLLQRLSVITSGTLRTKKDQGIVVTDEDKPQFTIRRAHYTIFSPESNVTLRSRSAKIHAQDIMDDYGIDIYDEIERRREMGNLGSTQFLTFSREHIGKNVDKDMLKKPNELRFDPEWMDI